MASTLILTPNKTEMCGMYQLAKDLAKELNADIRTKQDKLCDVFWLDYDTIITFLYPMHKYGKIAKENLRKWICYNQGIPPVTKQYFPNFWRRQAMRYINWRNNATMKGADEYWNVTEREQKPRWVERKELTEELKGMLLSRYGLKEDDNYFIYIGRTTDYKNFDKLKKMCQKLKIPLVYPPETMGMVRTPTDDDIHRLLSNAKALTTASTWEGYGRTVMEAQALGIPVVCFDTGVHKKLVKKGFVVPNHNFEMFKDKVEKVWEVLKNG